MKKLLSLLLVFSVVLSVVPVTIFADDVIVSTNDADIKVSEMTNEKNPEIVYRPKKTEESEVYSEPAISENEEIELMSSGYMISGIIYLPQGVTAKAGDKISVYTYYADTVTDGFVEVDNEGNTYSSTTVELYQGASSVSYSVYAPAGEYSMGFRYYNGHKEISSQMLYYANEGATYNKRLADKIILNGNKSGINVTLRPSTSYISGKIDLSENLPQTDTAIVVQTSNHDGLYNYNYARFPVSAGQRELYYEIGVEADSCDLRVGYQNKDTYYVGNGTLHSDYEKRRIFTLSSPVKNVDIKMVTSVSEKNFNVTINLSTTVNYEREYYISVFNKNKDSNGYAESYAGYWVYVQPGSSVINKTISVPVESGVPLCIGYKEVTGIGSIIISENESYLYYSEEFGIVGSYDKATDISGLGNVIINEPSFIYLEGNLSAEDNINLNRKLYVGIKTENEYYLDLVSVKDGGYKIAVPSRFSGKEYTLFYAENYQTVMTQPSVVNVGKGTLGSASGQDIHLVSKRTVSGTITLPVPASENGINIILELYIDKTSDEYAYVGDYVINPGETSVEYSYEIIGNDEYELRLHYNLETYEAVNCETNNSIILSDNFNDIELKETVNVSGTVSLPENMVFENDILIQICLSGDNCWNYSYFSISAGETSGEFKAKVLKDVKYRWIYLRVEDENVPLLSQVYYNRKTFVSDQVNADMTFGEDSILNGTLMKARVVNGVIKMAEGADFEGDGIRGNVYLSHSSKNSSYYSDIDIVNFDGEIPFSIRIPDEEATYRIFFQKYGNYDNNIISGNIYYVDNDTSTSDSQQAAVISPEDKTYVLRLIPSKKIEGEISFADGCVLNNGKLNIYLYARDTDGTQTFSHYINDITDVTESIPFSIDVLTEKEYTLEIYINLSSDGYTNIITNSSFYYTEDGLVSNVTEADIAEGTINIEIPTANSLSGKLKVPENFRYVSKPHKGYVYLSKPSGVSDGGRSFYNGSLYIDDNMNYTVNLPDDVFGEYQLSINLDRLNCNIIDKTYYYTGNSSVAGANSNINIQKGNDISGKDFNIETGITVSGTVKTPEDAYITGYNYYPRVNVYGYNAYCEALNSETSSVPFMVGIVSATSKGKIYAEIDSSDSTGTSESNLYTGTVYYVSDSESSVLEEDAYLFDFTDDISGLVINMQSSFVYDLTVTKPVSEQLYGNIYAVDENKQIIASEWFNIYNGDSTDTTLKIPKGYRNKNIYIYYDINSNNDGVYKKVYVNPDGTYSPVKSTAKPFKVLEDKTLEVDIKLTEDLIFPEYVVESEHPYQNDFTKTYKYTHPEEADELLITFSEETYIEYGDNLIIYDALGKMCLSESDCRYSNLAGKTISVAGNSFSMSFETSSSGTNYGFAVSEIKGINYLLESAHPYDNNTTAEYEYTYPEESEYLKIKFSTLSRLQSGDYLYIYDKNGNNLYSLGYYDLNYNSNSENEFLIPGNYFKIKLVSNYAYNDFGFGITEIITPELYTVTFKDYDGTVLYTDSVVEGKTAFYNAEEPCRPTEGNVGYVFNGWDKNLDNIKENMVVNALYRTENVVIESPHPCQPDMNVNYDYTHNEAAEGLFVTFSGKTAVAYGDCITFYDKDGNYLESYNSSSALSGQTIYIPGNEFRINFTTGSAEAGTTGAYGFRITKIEKAPHYTVTFKDYDGSVLYTEKVVKGRNAEYEGEIPYRATEGTKGYVFEGWDKAFDNITSDLVVNALYRTENVVLESEHPYGNNVYKEYTYIHPEKVNGLFVTFSDATSLADEGDYIYIYYGENDQYFCSYNCYSAPRGMRLQIPADRFKIVLSTNSDIQDFGFRITEVAEAKIYTVTFVDYNGTVLETKTVSAGDNAYFTGTLPLRPAYGKKIYTFTGWDKNTQNVNENLTVTALYEEREGYLESPHSYPQYANLWYYYTHDAEAEELYVTFSYDTNFENKWDKLYIYDAFGNSVNGGYYTSTSLSGATITIPGSSFSMNLTSDGSVNYYGFRITDIQAKLKVVKPKYEVTYLNADGEIIYSEIVEEGMPSLYYGDFPEKESANPLVKYVFKGWDKDTTCITDNLTVSPVYEVVEYEPIYTEEDLNGIRDNMDGRFILMNDITLENPWTPIGGFTIDEANVFKGEINGNRHIIKNVVIEAVNDTEMVYKNYGFFSYIRDAKIYNLGIEFAFGGKNDYRAFESRWGGFAAMAYNSEIYECYAKGTMEMSSQMPASFGGFIEYMNGCSIKDCYSDVQIKVTGPSKTVSGFAGFMNGSNVVRSYSNTSVTQTDTNSITVYPFVNSFYASNGYNNWFADSYYNMDRMANATSTSYINGIMGIGANILKDKNAYLATSATGGTYYIWDFDNVWNLDDNINDGFPNLRFENKDTVFNENGVFLRETEKMIEINLTASNYNTGELYAVGIADDKNVALEIQTVGGVNKNIFVMLEYEDVKPEEVKIFFWDNLENLRPLSEPIIVKVPENGVGGSTGNVGEGSSGSGTGGASGNSGVSVPAAPTVTP